MLGSDKSSLGPSFARLISTRGMRITADEHPERGYFYRSDHFAFAKAGVPAVSIGAGNDYVGKPADWGRQQAEEYTAEHYHQPSDEYRPDFDLSGAVQLAELIASFGLQLASNPDRPKWNPDSEFARVRAAVP